MSCLRGSFAKSLDLVENGVRRRRPDKGFAVLIVMRQVTLNRRLQCTHVLKGAAPNALRRLAGLPSYFLVSNVAFAVATLRFLRGETMATWRPRGG